MYRSVRFVKLRNLFRKRSVVFVSPEGTGFHKLCSYLNVYVFMPWNMSLK